MRHCAMCPCTHLPAMARQAGTGKGESPSPYQDTCLCSLPVALTGRLHQAPQLLRDSSRSAWERGIEALPPYIIICANPWLRLRPVRLRQKGGAVCGSLLPCSREPAVGVWPSGDVRPRSAPGGGAPAGRPGWRPAASGRKRSVPRRRAGAWHPRPPRPAARPRPAPTLPSRASLCRSRAASRSEPSAQVATAVSLHGASLHVWV